MPDVLRISNKMKKTYICHCERSEAISNVEMSVLLEVEIAAVAALPRNDK